MREDFVDKVRILTHQSIPAGALVRARITRSITSRVHEQQDSIYAGTVNRETGVERHRKCRHQFSHGRGTLVVQQSPKLPYGGAIPSVRAILAETYRLSDRGVTREHYGVHPACSQPGGMLTAICRPVFKLNLQPSERKQDGLLPRGL